MVHYGKHIIEPETGLCEICDRGAIHDYKKGKRPGRQFLYSNQDGRFTYRPSDDDEIRYNPNDATPRYVRKPLYPEPPPPRPRPVVQKEPVIPKKTPRREYSPVDDDNQHTPQPRPTTFYYVDNTGQMYPKNQLPPDETPRNYVVQDYHRSPPTNRPTRTLPRRAQTPPPPRPPPPPPASEPLRTKPRRQNHPNEENLQQSHRSQTQDVYYQSPTRKAELYHIDKHQHDTHSSISASIQESYDHHSAPAKNIPRRDTFQKPRTLDPVERNYHTEPEPTVVRKVYKKLPSTRDEYPAEPPPSNRDRGRVVRKIETLQPPPQQQYRTYNSSPQLANGNDGNPIPNRATVYYVESANRY